MTLDELRTLHDSMPRGSAISLTRKALGDLLSGLGPPESRRRAVGDLTLVQAAERVGRAVSTVRGWCSGGLLKGAYKLSGRDWRVPPAALDAFLREQGRQQPRPSGPAAAGHDLSAWRSEYGTDLPER